MASFNGQKRKVTFTFDRKSLMSLQQHQHIGFKKASSQHISPTTRHLILNQILQIIDKYISAAFKKKENCHINKENTLLTILKKNSHRVAKAIEQKLYSDAAPSLKLYSDRTTLNTRVRNVLLNSLKKQHNQNHDAVFREHRQPPTTPTTMNCHFAKEKHKLLEARLGSELYKDINVICHEIKTIRRDFQSWRYLSQRHHKHPSQKNYLLRRVSNTLPLCISKVYFNLELVRAFDCVGARTHVLDLNCVIAPDWSALLDEARAHLDNFRQLKENESHDDDVVQRDDNGGCGYGWGGCGSRVGINHETDGVGPLDATFGL